MATKKESSEPLLFCQVIQNCAGVKRPQFSGQKIKYKNYRIGDRIKGREHNDSQIPMQSMPTIKTLDGFIINASNLTVLGEEQDAEVLNDKDLVSERLKNKFNTIFSNANGTQGIVSDQRRKTKFMVNGAISGGTLLVLYAVIKGGNKTSCFIFGAIIGGTIGKFLADYRNREDNESRI